MAFPLEKQDANMVVRGVNPHRVATSASTGGLASSREVVKSSAKPEQRWLDVEARMLANWQEFIKHRQEVQLQLQEIHETLLKAASTESAFRQRDREFEAEVSRCSQRVQQLTQAQDGLAISFDKLHSSVESSQEALRDRFNKKMNELSSVADGQQRDVSKVGDALLREAADAAKRTSRDTCRSLAEELLRKMEELNAKLGENMASLEEESTWALQRVQQDVKDLATKADSATFSAEAEVRKLEARLESTWRMRIGEVETQLQQLSDNITRAERDAGSHAGQTAKLETRLQECAQNTGTCERALQSMNQRIEWSSTKIDEVQTASTEQIGRLREDIASMARDQERVFHKALDDHLEKAEARLQQLRADVSIGIADACDRTDALRETLSSHESSIASLRFGTEKRFEELGTSLETTRDITHEDVAHSQLALREELGQQLKHVTSQFGERFTKLDAQTKELRVLVEPLRLELADLHSRHQADMADYKERVEQLKDQARKAAASEGEFRKRADQIDQNLKQLRDMNDSREQRVRSNSLQLVEQISEVREQAHKYCREQIDEFAQMNQTLARNFQHEVENKFEALQSSLNSQSSALIEQSRRLCADASQQSRAWVDEAISKSVALVAETREKVCRIDVAVSDLHQADEILRNDVTHRNETIERQHVELSAHVADKLRDVYEQFEGLRKAEQEHCINANMTSKVWKELAETKSEYARELEAAKKSAQRQLEEAVARVEARLEQTSSAYSKSLSETRAAARATASEAAEKAERTAISNMQVHCDASIEDLKKQLATMRKESKDQEMQHETRLATCNQDTNEQLRQHKDVLLQQIADVKSQIGDAKAAFDEQFRRQHAGASEQVSQLRDEIVDKLRQQMGTQMAKLEEATHKLTDHIKISVSGVEEWAAETLQKRHDHLSKELASLQSQVAAHRDQTKDDHRKAEDRITQTARSLIQEVTELQSLARSHEEKLSCHQQHIAEDTTLSKTSLRSLGDEIGELRTVLSGLSERMESQKRQTIDLQENTADQLVKRMQDLSKDISDLRSITQGLKQNITQAADSQQKLEARSVQLVRDVSQEVAELQVWKVAEIKSVQSLQQELEDYRLQQAHSLKTSEENFTDQLAKLTDKTTKRLAEVNSHCAEQLDTRAKELRMLVEPLVDTHGKHQADLADLKSKTEQLREHAQKAATAENEFRRKAEQMEHALKQLRELCGSSEQRLQSTTLQLTESIHETREQVQKICGERVQELEQTNQARTRELQHEIESKIDALQSALTLQTSAANDQSKRLHTEAIQQSRSWIDEAFSRSAALVSEVREKASRIDAAFIDFVQADELLRKDVARQMEAIERHHTESSAQVREKINELHERCNEVQANVTSKVHERCNEIQANMTSKLHERCNEVSVNVTSKLGGELVEAKSEHNRELSLAKKFAQDQVEAAAVRLESRLEAAVTAHSKGSDDFKKQLATLHAEHRDRATQHDTSVASLGHGVDERMRQHRDDVVQQITDVKIGLEEQLRRQQTTLSEQLTEVNDKFVERLRQQMTTQSANLEETTSRLAEHMKTSVASLDEQNTQVQKKKDEQYTKEFSTLRTQEDRIAQSLKVLTQEVNDLKSTARNHDDRISGHQESTTEDGAAAKQALRSLGNDIVEIQATMHNLSERLESQKRETIDLQENSAEQLSKRLQEHSKDITDLRMITRGLSENCSQAAEMQRTMEVRSTQLVRNVGEEVKELQIWRLSEVKELQGLKDELTSQKFQQTKSLKIVEESLFEKISKLTEKTSESIAEARTSLTDLVRNTHETLSESTMIAQKDYKSMNEDLQRFKDKNEIHWRDTKIVQDKIHASLRELGKTTEKSLQDGFVDVHRRVDEVESMASQPRILSIIGNHADGLIRTVVSQELQVFQREALDSVEWKLERCVQWLHGANVKLGLNPTGTMFSTDRFRQMLFDDANRTPNTVELQAVPLVPGAPVTPRSRRRAHSAGAGKNGRGVRSSP